MNTPTQDWTVEEDSRGFIACLGDVVARGDSWERAAQSLVEKLDLLKMRLVSLGRPAPQQQREQRAPGRIIQ